jgi:hypothetical protein
MALLYFTLLTYEAYLSEGRGEGIEVGAHKIELLLPLIIIITTPWL